MIPEGTYFDLPMAEYRADPAVNQSLLKEFNNAATPLHFKHRKPKEATADMEFGTVCHCAVLEPHKLGEAFYLRPDDYPAAGKKGEQPVNKPWHGGAEWCKNWLEAHKDRPVITREQLDKIPKIVERLKRLPEFGSALAAGQKEVSFFKRDEETGLLLKCRCDVLAVDSTGTTWIFDPKKTGVGCSTHSEFSQQAMNLGYHIQYSSYLSITGASRMIFVSFEDDEPFDAIQWEPDADFRELGYREWRRLLKAYTQCVERDEWPGYADGIQRLSPPKWATKDL